MESTIGDDSEIITRLRQEIKDRNKDIHLAATVGKELLKEKEYLAEKLDVFQSENETLRQQKYSLQLDLETKVQTVNTQSSELELQREQYYCVIKELEVLRKESITHKQQINNLKRERSDFEKTQEDIQLENKSLKNKIESLECHIKGLQLKVEASLNVEVVEELDKECDTDYYKHQNKILSEALSELQCDFKSSKVAENRLTKLVKELEEGVHDRDKELSAYSIEIQKAQNYANELKGEIEILKLEQVDVNRRGNSVFGEIDERRKIIEREYKLLMKRYENLSKNFKAIKKELMGCKGQMSLLFSMTSRTHQDSYIDKLEDQLSSSRREMENLVAKLRQLLMDGQQRREEQTLSGSGEYDYLRVMNEEAEKKIKDLEHDLISVHLQKIASNDDLVQTQQKMYSVQKELDKANMEIMKLHHKIKELTLTIETEVPNVDEAEIVVREFDPNKSPNPKYEKMNRRKDKKNENEPNEAHCITNHTIMEAKESLSVLSSGASHRPVLQDCNEKPTSETCQNAKANPIEKKTEVQDHLAYLNSSPFKRNVRNSSSRTDRKEGQCAQQ